jgi:large subunit ribosomal protein L21
MLNSIESVSKRFSMYAVVQIAGQQRKVAIGETLNVNRLPQIVGEQLVCKDVLLLENEQGEIVVGAPTIANARVLVRVTSHFRGDKVIVFKKKRRKGYCKKNGHRQNYSRIHVDQIIAQ